MSSPASIVKHPIHPMLVVFPLGLLNFSLAADLIYNSTQKKVWKDVALQSMGGGIIGALAAAVPGLIDFFSLKGRAKKLGIAHMAMNLGIVGLYSYNFWRRRTSPKKMQLPMSLSVAGTVGLLVSGWLGGELVYVEGAGVETGGKPGEIEGAKEEQKISEPAS